MNITEAVLNVRTRISDLGLTRAIRDDWDDEDLIIYALNFFAANIEDALYEDEDDEFDSESIEEEE